MVALLGGLPSVAAPRFLSAHVQQRACWYARQVVSMVIDATCQHRRSSLCRLAAACGGPRPRSVAAAASPPLRPPCPHMPAHMAGRPAEPQVAGDCPAAVKDGV